MHSARRTAQTLVVGAGASTTALPYASAGATISAGIVYGQFHGLITLTTPRGTRYRKTRLPASTEGGMRPSARVASAAAMSKYAISSSTSSRASASSGLPWSSASVRASSSRRASIAAATRRIAAARSNADDRAHAGQACCAAAIARLASAREPSGTVAITSPVEGLCASKVAPSTASTHAPPIHIRTCSFIASSRARGVGGGPRTAPAGVRRLRSGRPVHVSGHAVGSQADQTSSFSDTHCAAASSGSIPSTSIRCAIASCSSLV